jgi:hypothetical protein
LRNEAIKHLINSIKGISGTGNVLAEYVALQESVRHIILEPGDYVVTGDDSRYSSAPIAYDMWYLNQHENLITIIVNNDKDSIKAYLDQNLSFLSDKLLGIKPLKTISNIDQLLINEELLYPTPLEHQFMITYVNDGEYFINKLAFEVWLKNLGCQYSSDGPKQNDVNDYCGYLAVPVGQHGAMEVISVFQETDFDDPAFLVEENEKAQVVTSPDLFPPTSPWDFIGNNNCYGRHLIENGYLVPEEAINKVEYFAEPIPEDKYESVAPKFWMRFWFHKDEAFPVPGEFVGILCRPLIPPPHIWWFQESSPFLFSGHWVETNNLTSGKITGITEETDRTDGGIGRQYSIKIHGYEVLVDASDFLSYTIGDRVGVLKKETVYELATKSFTWKDEEETKFGYAGLLKLADVGQVKTKYEIIPISFYVN